MKKRGWVFIIILVVIFLILPVRKVANDGGTIVYSSALYKVIKWNRIRNYEENKTGTEVYFFPKNLHSLDYYDAPRPEAIAIYNGDKFVVANIGTYQWSKEVDGTTLYVNACGLGPLDMEYKETLKIPQGSNVKTILPGEVTEIKIYKYDGNNAEIIENNLKYDEITQEIDTKELEKGIYIIEPLVENENNKVRYSFKLEVVDEIEYEQFEDTVSDSNLQTFYAEIKNINGSNLLVDGLDVNDINYRGEFSFKVTEETKLEWRNFKIEISDLDEGDNISITFEGEIQETYPDTIRSVIRIQLLDDKNKRKKLKKVLTKEI